VNARALGLLALAQVAIGAAAIFARFALTAAGPLSVSALRMAIAAVPVVIVAALRGRYARFDTLTERRLLLAGLHWPSTSHLDRLVQHASVAVSTLLVCSTPVFTEAWHLAARGGHGRPCSRASSWRQPAVAVVAGVPSPSESALGIGLALLRAVAMAATCCSCGPAIRATRRSPVVGRTYPIAALALGCSPRSPATAFRTCTRPVRGPASSRSRSSRSFSGIPRSTRRARPQRHVRRQ